MEYFGPGVFKQSCTGLATVANMGAEVGATTSTFPYTPNMRAYLTATGRAPVARAADEAASNGFLAADEGAQYDEVIEIVSLFVYKHAALFVQIRVSRIFLPWSRISMDRSHRTWQLPCQSSVPSSRSKGGRMNFRLA